MNADVARPPLDGQARARGDVPRDEGTALESVENGEAVGIPSIGGVLRGLTLAVAQAGPLSREAKRLARDSARIVRGTDEFLPSSKDKPATPRWSG